MFYKKDREVVCTASVSSKNPKPGLIPARRRYLGEHIRLADSVAGFRPFYILSAKLGLISAKTGIGNYVHCLTQEEVGTLAQRVSDQIKRERIKVLFYYQGSDPEWEPYTAVLSRAVHLSHIGLVHMPLPTKQEIVRALPQTIDAPALA